MLSRDNTLLKIAEAYKKQQSKTMEFVDEVFGQVYTIAVEDANEFITKAAAAKKAGESTFKLGGKEYPVTIKIDPDKVLEAERVLKKGKGDMPDVIINPTDDDLRESESVVSEAENDDKYVVIDFHEKGGGFVMTKPGSKKDAEDSARSIRKGSDISKREVLKVSDARKIRGLAGKNYLNEESLNDGEEPKIITQLRDVVKSGGKPLKDPKSGRRMTVDRYSASAIVGVYDKLNPSNQEKFVKTGLLGMQSLAFKLLD